MIPIRSAAEVEAIADAGAILARLFAELAPRVVPGASTHELDRVAETFIRSHSGARPAFKGLYGFPATLCTSINEEVVHGIPARDRRLEEGDIVSIDAGVRLRGWFADHAMTFPVGTVDADTLRLLAVTREALDAGIAQARPGNRLGDIGAAVQEYAESAGFSVVRELVGHGIGRQPHEKPEVPNYGRPGTGLRLLAGLVLAIEPMINLGGPDILTLDDEWTVVTVDRSRSAHFEHTVAVTDEGPRILTVA